MGSFQEDSEEPQSSVCSKRLIKIFTLASIYLIVSIPVVFASTTVSIFAGGFTGEVVIPEMVSQQVSVESVGIQNWNINILIENTTSHTLGTIYVYKCFLLSPSDCVDSVSPDYYSGSQTLVLPWSSISELVGFSEIGNVLVVARVNTPGGTFKSFWHSFIRDSGQSPQYQYQSSDISSVELHTTPDKIQTIEDYVEDTGVIPFNLVTNTILTGSTLLHNLLGTPPSLNGLETPGDDATPLAEGYTLIHPQSTVTYNGVTFYSAPEDFLCGGDVDGNGNMCDSGETQQNCCYDCGCSTGFYCDAVGTCLSSSAISLQVIEPTNTFVTNCNEYNTITVTVQLNNLPSDSQISERSYILDGTDQYSLNPSDCTEPLPGVYTCTLTVPPVVPCIEGSFLLSDNSITFDVRYSDGPDQVTSSLSDAFGDVTIGSWECGDTICDLELGETQQNCCYDCGCSSGYCDYQPGTPKDSGVCVPDPYLTIESFTELFTIHSSYGNDVALDMTLRNTPVSLSTNSPTCTMDCLSGGTACSSSCSLSCTETGDYAASCTLTFTVSGYDQEESYSLAPTITLPASYSDGPTTISAAFEAEGDRILLGPHFCGDKNCDVDESQSSCCYDCGCGTGAFCNTVSPSIGPDAGDVCAPSGFSLVIDDVDPTEFIDQTIPHTLNVTAHIDNPPPLGITNPTYSCSLLGGTIPCTIDGTTCTPLTADQTEFLCEITIPTFSGYESQEILIQNNALSVTFEYNNGSRKDITTLETQIDDITITQVSHCGRDGCETFLGESATDCCIDCPCSENPSFGLGSICVPGGGQPNSTCISNTSITLSLKEISPAPLECEILPPNMGRGCVFTGSVKFTFQVNNAPSTLRLTDANHLPGGGDEFITCRGGRCACLQDPEDSSIIKCYLLVETIDEPENSTGFSSIEGGSETRSNSFFFFTTYRDSGFTISQDFSTTVQYDIYKDDTQIATCESQYRSVSRSIDNYESNKAIVMGIMAVVWAYTITSAVRCACCSCCLPWCAGACPAWITYFVKSCKEAFWMFIISSCITGILMPLYGNYDASLQEMKAEKSMICAAPDTAALGSIMDISGQLTYRLIGAVGTIICIIGTMGASGGESASAGAGAGASGASGGGGVTGPPAWW